MSLYQGGVMLTFSESGHVYTWKGEPVPSVTSILKEWVRVDIGQGWYVSTFTGQIVDADTFEAAGRMGTAIHDILHAYLEDDLDEYNTSPELLKALAQFKEWQKVFRPETLHFEAKMYSEKYGVAGTCDLIAMIGRHKFIIDYKSGAYSTAGPQLAAYEKLYQESIDSRTPLKRAVLRLPKSGEKFKWIPMTDRDDWTFFTTRLYQYSYFKKGRG